MLRFNILWRLAYKTGKEKKPPFQGGLFSFTLHGNPQAKVIITLRLLCFDGCNL